MWLAIAACAAPPPTVAVPAPPPASEPAPEPIPTGPFRRELAPGLVVAAYDPPPLPAGSGPFAAPDPGLDDDRRLFVVTVDLQQHALVYLSTKDDALGAERMPADAWAARYDLQVAFNPGMFEPDDAPTGYTRAGEHPRQPELRRTGMYRGWFVAGGQAMVLDQRPPSGEGRYGSFSELPATFRSRIASASFVTQSLPILRDGAPVYPPRGNVWSELCFGADRDGRLVIVFSRWPYEMRELGARVAALGIGVDALVHGEGGPEATLVVRAGGVDWRWVGSYETGFSDGSNTRAWSLPAVLGVR